MVEASNPHNSSQTHTGGSLHHRKVPCFTNTNPIEWLDTVTVETGGNGNRWWHGASIKKSHSTHSPIPYARMNPHWLSIKHQAHGKRRGKPSGNQQPIRIIWPTWWKVGPVHSRCNHKRSPLSLHTLLAPLLWVYWKMFPATQPKLLSSMFCTVWVTTRLHSCICVRHMCSGAVYAEYKSSHVPVKLSAFNLATSRRFDLKSLYILGPRWERKGYYLRMSREGGWREKSQGGKRKVMLA